MQPDSQQPNNEPSQSFTQPSGPVISLTPDVSQQLDPQEYGVRGQNSVLDGPVPAEPIRWQAAEYVHREKDQAWFIIFAVITLIFIAIAVFLIRSPTFAILVPIMAAALFIYNRHPPRVLDYTLGRHGLYINDKLFPFGDFKGFALLSGLDQHTIMLIPTKRFKPAVTINFPEEAGEAIIDALAPRLPMREMQADIIDRFIRKLHL